MRAISLSTSRPYAFVAGREEVRVSRFEALVVSSAARLGVDELLLLCAAILLLLFGAVGLVVSTHLIG